MCWFFFEFKLLVIRGRNILLIKIKIPRQNLLYLVTTTKLTISNFLVMKKILLMSFVVVFLLGCGAGNKNNISQNSVMLNGMIETKSFEIISKRAYPLMTSAMQQLGNAGLFGNGSTAGSIDLTTHTNYLRMKNDSVMASLPFYGERQMGGGYTNASGIEFEDIPKDLQMSATKDHSYEIRFNINDKNSSTENYQVYIKLSPNLASNIVIKSSHRSNIQYVGHVQNFQDN